MPPPVMATSVRLFLVAHAEVSKALTVTASVVLVILDLYRMRKGKSVGVNLVLMELGRLPQIVIHAQPSLVAE